MEYCPFGDLDQKIRRFYQRRKLIDEREIWVYAINILEGLVALHQKGVVHRGTPFSLTLVAAMKPCTQTDGSPSVAMQAPVMT